MRLRAFCGLPDGSEWLRDELEEDASDPEALGVALADRMKAAGACGHPAESASRWRICEGAPMMRGVRQRDP